MDDNTKKPSKFGLGLLIGSVLGGIAAFFLSPTSGPENREMVAKKIKELEKLMEEKEVDKHIKEIFGEVTEEVKLIYEKAKTELIKRLAELKETVQNIDKEKYMNVVEDVMTKIKKETKKDIRQLEKLKSQLIREWSKLQSKAKN